MATTLAHDAGAWTRKPSPDVLVNPRTSLRRNLYGWGFTLPRGLPRALTTPEVLQPDDPSNSPALWESGARGTHITMDGTFGWRKTSLTAPVHGQGAVTVAVRFRPASLSTGGTNDYLLSFPLDAAGANGLDLRQNDGNLLFDISTSSTDTIGPYSHPLTTGWQTVVLVFNGNDSGGMSYALYAHDGALVATDFINQFVTGTLDAASNEVNIGDFGSAFHSYWAGAVDFMLYWTRVLNRGEIHAIFNDPMSLFEPRSRVSQVPLLTATRYILARF